MDKKELKKIWSISKMWREELRVPPYLSEVELLRFWAFEDKPYMQRVETVKKYAENNNTRVFIESGTYHGAMISAVANYFDRIISIELDDFLFRTAKLKFSQNSNISILQGDSGKLLREVLKTISQPCLFWLDGHYIPNSSISARGEKDTPIIKELESILEHDVQNHVILIDDARCFIGKNIISNDYPTIQELKEFVNRLNNELTFEVKDDIIRIYKSHLDKTLNVR